MDFDYSVFFWRLETAEVRALFRDLERFLDLPPEQDA